MQVIHQGPQPERRHLRERSCRKKSPEDGILQKMKPVSGTSAQFEANRRRSTPADATKELENLAGYMPEISDTDTMQEFQADAAFLAADLDE